MTDWNGLRLRLMSSSGRTSKDTIPGIDRGARRKITVESTSRLLVVSVSVRAPNASSIIKL